MQQKYNYINYHYTVSQKNWATTINIINCSGKLCHINLI